MAPPPVAAGVIPGTQMDHTAPTYMLANLTHLHSEQLLQGLNLLRQHHELCDIILRVGDVKIHAHKVVLASISPYFKAMFTGNLSEKENSEVEFQCIDEAALQAIVEYAYTGTVFISQDTVESLLPAANLLQIKLVLKECCAFLESQLDPGIVLEFLVLRRLTVVMTFIWRLLNSYARILNLFARQKSFLSLHMLIWTKLSPMTA